MLSSSSPLRKESSPKPINGTPTKPVVVGIYGVPGSGKSHVLDLLKDRLSQEAFSFYEGSEKIAKVTPGGLDAFHRLSEPDRRLSREAAIRTVAHECRDTGKTALVTGHLSFWPDEDGSCEPVYTEADLETYTHILYLDVPAETVVQRCQNDAERRRPLKAAAHVSKWQENEKSMLHSLCQEKLILFRRLSSPLNLLTDVVELLRDFHLHNERYNQACAEARIDSILSAYPSQPTTMLVIDADKTLSTEDTGEMFWQNSKDPTKASGQQLLLKTLFSSRLGYSYLAFRQAMLYYEEAAEKDFESTCENVAQAVDIHPEFLSLFRLISAHEHVRAVVVTCGLGCLWEAVLSKLGLSEEVKVIGGGRLRDGFVITPSVKAALVIRLQRDHGVHVWAIGDSPLDIGMLSSADQAIVVAGKENNRSKSMDAMLKKAVDEDGLNARQVLLPENSPPRLDTAKIPVIRLDDDAIVHALLSRRDRRTQIRVFHATDENTAKLLMTPMRDAGLAGPGLREVHHRVGWYLAIKYMADMVGLEESRIPHVQGHLTSGYRLAQEQNTCIVALMRGGESMAFGVNEAFPLAMFTHAKCPDDVKQNQLEDIRTVVLVDSVVNSGKTIMQFVRHIHQLYPAIHIVVIAGVIQAHFLAEKGPLRSLNQDIELSIIALRVSDNKYTGKGTTDTGNRLFNTTHMP